MACVVCGLNRCSTSPRKATIRFTRPRGSAVSAAQPCGRFQSIAICRWNLQNSSPRFTETAATALCRFSWWVQLAQRTPGPSTRFPQIADIATKENLWFHADAAWGGAAALVPELRPLLAGIERADSITLDAHKWLSVPMGAGILLTRHPQILGRTFHISAAYVPPKADGTGFDAYEHSLQWSRRFIGLKIFMSLAVAGWEGYATTLRQMTQVGQQLRRELEAADWDVVNSTELPICCFQDRRSPDGRSADYLDAIVHEVVASGDAWISTTRVRGNIPVLRACITSYRTNADDLRIMVSALNAARAKLQSEKAAKIARTATPEA